MATLDTLTTCAPLFEQPRQQIHGQPDGGEVVDLHGSLEVVMTADRLPQAAPDRAAGVVDQHIDARVFGQQAGTERVHRSTIGEIGDMDLGTATGGLDV